MQKPQHRPTKLRSLRARVRTRTSLPRKQLLHPPRHAHPTTTSVLRRNNTKTRPAKNQPSLLRAKRVLGRNTLQTKRVLQPEPIMRERGMERVREEHTMLPKHYNKHDHVLLPLHGMEHATHNVRGRMRGRQSLRENQPQHVRVQNTRRQQPQPPGKTSMQQRRRLLHERVREQLLRARNQLRGKPGRGMLIL